MAKVKICGITNQKDAKLAASLGAWALGFVLYKKSPRYITPSRAKNIIKKLPSSVIPVGVFVNEKKERINKITRTCGFKAIQLHGDESPEFCSQIKCRKIIKAFRVGLKFDLAKVKKYKTNMYLFDTFRKGLYGGSGRTFKWGALKGKSKILKPFILSGGINSKNVAKAIKELRPYAVDVSSGVEKLPGKKSEKLLKELFLKVIG